MVLNEPKDGTQIEVTVAKPDLQLDGLESNLWLADLKEKELGLRIAGLLEKTQRFYFSKSLEVIIDG